MKELQQSIRTLFVLTIITGLIYPLLVSGIGSLLWSSKVNGSLIMKNGKILGSALIGQEFAREDLFHSRPSATSPMPYNAASSGGSNLAPSNPKLRELAALRMGSTTTMPVELATSSASGLDPHISPAAALFQVRRIAAARNMSENSIRQIIDRLLEARTLGFLGEPRVNVLRLNLALEEHNETKK